MLAALVPALVRRISLKRLSHSFGVRLMSPLCSRRLSSFVAATELIPSVEAICPTEQDVEGDNKTSTSPCREVIV